MTMRQTGGIYRRFIKRRKTFQGRKKGLITVFYGIFSICYEF